MRHIEIAEKYKKEFAHLYYIIDISKHMFTESIIFVLREDNDNILFKHVNLGLGNILLCKSAFANNFE